MNCETEDTEPWIYFAFTACCCQNKIKMSSYEYRIISPQKNTFFPNFKTRLQIQKFSRFLKVHRNFREQMSCSNRRTWNSWRRIKILSSQPRGQNLKLGKMRFLVFWGERCGSHNWIWLIEHTRMILFGRCSFFHHIYSTVFVPLNCTLWICKKYLNN